MPITDSQPPRDRHADGPTRSPWREYFLAAVIASIVLAVATTTSTDPDLWGHLRFGLDIIEQREVHVADPYSFTSDRRWINHEWLAEATFGLAYLAAQTSGLLLLKLLLVVAAGVVTYRTLRIGASSAESRLLMLLPLAALMPLTQTVRPQLFSILAYALMLWLTLQYRATGRPKYLVALPPLFCAWANAHGGWVLGGATLAAVLLPSALHASTRARAMIAGTLVACAAAPLVNPYGPGLYVFLFETLSVPRPEITEWQPVVRDGWDSLALWVATAAVAAYWFARGYWRRHPLDALVIVVLGILAFQVVRTLGFWALTTAALLSLDGSADAPGAERSRPLRLSAAEISVLTFAMAASLVLTVANLRCLDADWLPAQGDVAYIQDAQPARRLLTWFNWGQYAIWHLGPEVQVSFDGRRETVYSHEFIEQHLNLYLAGPNWREFFDRLAPDLVWLPPTVPVVSALVADGWHEVRRSEESVILARIGSEHPPSTTPDSQEPRCFPNP
jgi:hypothetical protein